MNDVALRANDVLRNEVALCANGIVRLPKQGGFGRGEAVIKFGRRFAFPTICSQPCSIHSAQRKFAICTKARNLFLRALFIRKSVVQ